MVSSNWLFIFYYCTLWNLVFYNILSQVGLLKGSMEIQFYIKSYNSLL